MTLESALIEISALKSEREALIYERDRFNQALTRIRTEDLSRFDCTLIAAEAQGLIR